VYAPVQNVAGRPGQTGITREGIQMRSYIPGSAMDQTRFGAKSDHSLSRFCYGLRRYIPSVEPQALRCAPVRPYTQRSAPGISGRALV